MWLWKKHLRRRDQRLVGLLVLVDAIADVHQLSHSSPPQETALPGITQCIEEMDDADQGLESRPESVHYPLW